MDVSFEGIIAISVLVVTIIIFITFIGVDYEQNKDADECIELLKDDYELYIYDTYKDIYSYNREELKEMLLEYIKDGNNKIEIYDGNKEIRIIYEPIVWDSDIEEIINFLF